MAQLNEGNNTDPLKPGQLPCSATDRKICGALRTLVAVWTKGKYPAVSIIISVTILLLSSREPFIP